MEYWRYLDSFIDLDRIKDFIWKDNLHFNPNNRPYISNHLSWDHYLVYLVFEEISFIIL